MKKTLVALAALAAFGTASAQSSVTLFGVLDAAVSGYSNKSENDYVRFIPGYESLATVTTSSNGLTNSGNTSSRLGFRGTEDLGGGMAASFWLEAGLGNDEGTAGGGGSQLFNRRSTVSLSGAFGEVRLGRDYTPTYWNDTVFDPFGANGVGSNLIYTASKGLAASPTYPNQNYQRASNSVGYFLPPNLGGVYGQLMYAFNEKDKYDPAILTPDAPNNQRAGRYVGGRLGYANGPLDVALAYGQSTIGDHFFWGFNLNQTVWNLGASYDFGPVKLFGEYSDTKIQLDDSLLDMSYSDTVNGWLVGASIPVGSGLVRASYSGVKIRNPYGDDPKADKFALGYVHNLSKRTALYGTVAYLKNRNGLALTVGGPAAFGGMGAAAFWLPTTSTGYDIGIRHSF